MERTSLLSIVFRIILLSAAVVISIYLNSYLEYQHNSSGRGVDLANIVNPYTIQFAFLLICCLVLFGFRGGARIMLVFGVSLPVTAFVLAAFVGGDGSGFLVAFAIIGAIFICLGTTAVYLLSKGVSWVVRQLSPSAAQTLFNYKELSQGVLVFIGILIAVEMALFPFLPVVRGFYMDQFDKDQEHAFDDNLPYRMSEVVTQARAYRDRTGGCGNGVSGPCHIVSQGKNVFRTSAAQFFQTGVYADPKMTFCSSSADGQAYAMAVKYRSNNKDWYCVDSKGYAGAVRGNTIANSGDVSCEE